MGRPLMISLSAPILPPKKSRCQPGRMANTSGVCKLITISIAPGINISLCFGSRCFDVSGFATAAAATMVIARAVVVYSRSTRAFNLPRSILPRPVLGSASTKVKTLGVL